MQLYLQASRGTDGNQDSGFTVLLVTRSLYYTVLCCKSHIPILADVPHFVSSSSTSSPTSSCMSCQMLCIYWDLETASRICLLGSRSKLYCYYFLQTASFRVGQKLLLSRSFSLENQLETHRKLLHWPLFLIERHPLITSTCITSITYHIHLSRHA